MQNWDPLQAAILGWVLLFSVPGVYADIIVPVDYATIQEALDNAASGEPVIVLSGIYYENVMMDAESSEKSYILQGIDAETTIIDGSGSGIPITLNSDMHASDSHTISNLTIQNSSDEGIVTNYATALITIDACILKNNLTGIRNWSTKGGDVVVSNSRILDNTEYGVHSMYIQTQIINCEISNNGIGIFNDFGTNMGVNDSCITRNDDHGILLRESRIEVRGSRIAENGNCGISAVKSLSSHLILESSQINNNLSAGIQLYGAGTHARDDRFYGNTIAYNKGPAIEINSESFSRCTIENNIIRNNDSDTSIIKVSCYLLGEILTLQNNYFYGNSYGNSVVQLNGFEYSIVHNTFDNNIAKTPSAKGVLEVGTSGSGTVAIINNIWSNHTTYGLQLNGTAPLTSCSVLTNDFYNNLPAQILWEGIPYTDIMVFNSALPYASDNISCDPELIVPGNFHLLPTSCCIDAGTYLSTVTKDLDGDSRSGVWDIGADQYSGLVVPVNNLILLWLLPIIIYIGVYPSIRRDF